MKLYRLLPSDLALFTELLRLFEEVFEMEDFRPPAGEHLQRLLARDDFFVFVALLEGRVVGGLTSYLLQQYYSHRPLVYLFDLAVATDLQYQGIGKQLLSAHNHFVRELGAETVMVQADAADAHALRFYRATGGHPEEVVHFDYSL